VSNNVNINGNLFVNNNSTIGNTGGTDTTALFGKVGINKNVSNTNTYDLDVNGSVSCSKFVIDSNSGNELRCSAPAIFSGITGNTGTFTFVAATQGITGPTGTFTFVAATQGITGPTGSFTNLNVSNNVNINGNLFVNNNSTIGNTGGSDTTALFGKVGINKNVTNTNTYDLDVNGSVTCTKFFISSNSGNDLRCFAPATFAGIKANEIRADNIPGVWMINSSSTTTPNANSTAINSMIPLFRSCPNATSIYQPTNQTKVSASGAASAIGSITAMNIDNTDEFFIILPNYGLVAWDGTDYQGNPIIDIQNTLKQAMCVRPTTSAGTISQNTISSFRIYFKYAGVLEEITESQ